MYLNSIFSNKFYESFKEHPVVISTFIFQIGTPYLYAVYIHLILDTTQLNYSQYSWRYLNLQLSIKSVQ
jgi:hypothetical protein